MVIQAYSASSLCNLIITTLSILSPDVLRTRDIFKTLTRHIQNHIIVKKVYSGIIQSYLGIFRTICNVCTCRNLAYSEFWNIQNPSVIASDTYSEPCYIYNNRCTLCNPGNSESQHVVNSGIFKTLTYLKPTTYSERSRRFKMECFGKAIKS